jgi:hypothetical protein
VTTLPHGMVSVSREDLYEKVWTISVTKLAKSYGISDVGLAKACKRHQIPRPPVGYWAQKAVGKAPERPPLPVVVDPKLQTVEFAPGPSRPKEPDESTLLQERVPTFDDQELKAAYLRSIRRLMTRRQRVIESGSELDAFLVWAEQVACRFDPLQPSETLRAHFARLRCIAVFLYWSNHCEASP